VTEPDRMTLAVVDDDIDVRQALGRLLRSLGHEVRLFSSAEEFQSDRPAVDCIVLDVRLPGLNGFEFHQQIRMRGSVIPVVFITGDNDPVRREEARRVNAPTLAKPFDGEMLMAAIVAAVSAAQTAG
jgi:FixJ family two-component response regulator